jgi:phosphatidylglycerophosphatase A
LQVRSHSLWDNTALILATGFGIGLVPVMPGTFGTLLGLPLAWALGSFVGPLPVELGAIAVVPLVFLLERITFSTAILGFVWFRIFDIAKPWPIRRLERLPGGLGIMIDDVMAAIYAAIALWLTFKAWQALPWGVASD